MHEYDKKDIDRLFGLSASAIRLLTRAGHLHPVRLGTRTHYSFQDLLVLRTVRALRAAGISGRMINRALRKLQAENTPHLSLSGLAIAAVGERIGVRHGQSLWDSESGQYALALESGANPADIAQIRQREVPSATNSAHEHFVQAVEREETDVSAALAAYQACLAADPRYVEARINLGRMLHLAGRLVEAEQIYRGSEEPSALLSFNLAVLLEDMEREAEAMAIYREAIGHDPAMADAHFNLARLHERDGDTKASFRHLLTYRRLLGD